MSGCLPMMRRRWRSDRRMEESRNRRSASGVTAARAMPDAPPARRRQAYRSATSRSMPGSKPQTDRDDGNPTALATSETRVPGRAATSWSRTRSSRRSRSSAIGDVRRKSRNTWFRVRTLTPVCSATSRSDIGSCRWSSMNSSAARTWRGAMPARRSRARRSGYAAATSSSFSTSSSSSRLMTTRPAAVRGARAVSTERVGEALHQAGARGIVGAERQVEFGGAAHRPVGDDAPDPLDRRHRNLDQDLLALACPVEHHMVVRRQHDAILGIDFQSWLPANRTWARPPSGIWTM